jgi:hypothetical protein
VDAFHLLSTLLHRRHCLDQGPSATQRSRLALERVLHVSTLSDVREERATDDTSRRVQSRVVVFSLFPLPGTSSSIATALALHRLACGNRATGAACAECLRVPDDLYVPLLPIEYDALLLNRMTHGVLHSPDASKQHERLVELYINPPGERHLCLNIATCNNALPIVMWCRSGKRLSRGQGVPRHSFA